MAPRVITVQPQEAPALQPGNEKLSQRAQSEARFLLQVDRQTKSSYATSEAAEAAGGLIKRAHSHLQVSVYDYVEGVTKLIKAPAAP